MHIGFYPTRNYITIYLGLTLEQAQKLANLAKKHGETESKALRKVLYAYLKDIEAKGLPFQPYKKISPLGMKVLPRTITMEQDRKLREIAEKTGRKISELAREAIIKFLCSKALTQGKDLYMIYSSKVNKHSIKVNRYVSS